MKHKVALALTAIAVATTFVYAGVASRQNADAVAAVERTLELGRDIDCMVVAIMDEESAVRAYHITRDRKFLQDVSTSRARYNAVLPKIRELSRNNPFEVERSEQLAKLGADKHAWMKTLLELLEHGKFEEATLLVRRGHGQVLMNEIQRLADAKSDDAHGQLLTEQATAARAQTKKNIAIAALCALLMASYVIIRRQSKTLLRTAKELQESEKHYRLLFEHSSDLVRLRARGSRTFFVSPSVEALLGYTPAELTQMVPSDYIHPDDIGAVLSGFGELWRDGAKRALTYRMRHKDGQYRWFDVEAKRVQSSDGSSHVQSSARDVTTRRELEERLARQAEELRELSLLDGLTGVYNRRGFTELAKPALRVAVRERQTAAIFFVDLDGLKLVNDRLGHEAGDKLIREAAEVLKKTYRESDIIARLGGDEFVVLAAHVGESPSAVRTRLERAAAELNALPGREYELSFSVGVALFDPLAPIPLDDLLKIADSRMYDAKVARRRQRRAQSSLTDPRQLAPSLAASNRSPPSMNLPASSHN